MALSELKHLIGKGMVGEPAAFRKFYTNGTEVCKCVSMLPQTWGKKGF